AAGMAVRHAVHPSSLSHMAAAQISDRRSAGGGCVPRGGAINVRLGASFGPSTRLPAARSPRAIKPCQGASPIMLAPSAFMNSTKETPMADSAASPADLPLLARIDPRLLRTAAVGGLLGGLVMFFLMAGYNASAGMGFLTILNVCFA